jgi:hypothetical protein
MIEKICQARFDPPTGTVKKLWKVVVEQRLQSYVPADASIADIGSGPCGFMSTVRC